MTDARPQGKWLPYDDGKTIGSRVSEGVVILDDEHTLGARITLERSSPAPFAITCGVYGSMVHTRFFGDEQQARAEFERMKSGLVEILDTLPLASDPNPDFGPSGRACAQFVDRFP